jgi:hypothetical protein
VIQYNPGPAFVHFEQVWQDQPMGFRITSAVPEPNLGGLLVGLLVLAVVVYRNRQPVR